MRNGNHSQDNCDITSTTESNTSPTYTQVGSCIYGGEYIERRRQSLRAKLEREEFERQQKLDNIFSSTFHNLFGKS